ncbi:MAG: LysE family translocator [Verrucomicrobia bacterium]|nr:LysE family translocator [Verrucomicrobiota bacterium]
MDFFFKGIILGFAIAAPVGPIGILCIRRTLQYGRLSGIFSGLGAAFADMLYGAIAIFGLDLLSDLLLSWQFWLRILGGIFLVFWGLRIFMAKPEEKTKLITHVTLIRDFLSTFLLTLSNPLTILSFIAVFVGLGIVKNVAGQGGWLVLGIFLGSCLWWAVLCEGVAFVRKRVSQDFMIWANRVAGLVIIGFGVAAFVSAAYSSHSFKAREGSTFPAHCVDK